MDHQNLKSLTAALCTELSNMDPHARIAALNEVRAALHAVSPLKHHPIDLVLWVPSDTVQANDYNPNCVAPPEMRLLAHSVKANGYTMPLVTHQGDAKREVVDGFHRKRVGTEDHEIAASVLGHLPVTCIRSERGDRAARIAATVEHNRARGEHRVGDMSEIVRMLYQAGWRDKKIQEELGMEPDEVLRLKQITGLAELFAGREYSESWEPLE